MGTVKKIIILHGWAYEHTKWVPFVNELIKKNFDIKLFNIPGLTAPLETVWNLDNYVAWLHQNLKNEDKVILLGHSNGGRIALAFAHKYPQKISHLILIASAGIYHRSLKRLIFTPIAKLGKAILPFSFLKTLLYKLAREHDYEQADPIVKKTLINLISADLTPMLSAIGVPTTLIWGSHDRTTPLSDGRKIHKLVKNSQLYVISGARHSPQFTYIDEVVKIIKQSL